MPADHLTLPRQLGLSYLSLGISLILGPFLIFLMTRTLSLTEYGVYTLLASVVTLSGVIFDLGISQYLITKLPGMKQKTKWRIQASILYLHLIFVLVLLVFSFTPSLFNFLISVIKIQGYETEFSFALFVAAGSIIFRVCNSFLIANKRLEFKALTDILPNMVLAVMLTFIYILFNSLTVISLMVIWLFGFLTAAVLGVVYLRMRNEFRFSSLSFNDAKNGYLFSLPLLPAIVGEWSVILVNRFFLNAWHGAETVALFALAYALVMIVNTVGNAVTNVLYPHIAERWNQKKDANFLFNSALKYAMVIVLPGTFILLSFGEQIITMISGVRYAPAAAVLPYLVWFPVIFVLIYLFRQQLLLRNRTKLMGLIFAGGAILNIILNLILIPPFAMVGAAISTLLSYLAIYGAAWYFCRGFFAWHWRFLKLERILAASVIISILFLFINTSSASLKIGALIVAGIIYILLLFFLKVFDKNELEMLKGFLKSLMRIHAS
ncbi:MAG: polysaccharide biosynthesis C-terminal domain-containing protein [Nanoarchaeota archaeon]